jgi:inward rectifier potassium channel
MRRHTVLAGTSAAFDEPWSASGLRSSKKRISNAGPSFSEAFFFSIETLATVGYGVMAPATLYGHIVSSVEILCGLTFTALVTGLIFVRFSRPRAKFRFAENAVVTTYNGKPTLMVRVGNGKLTLLADARAGITAVLREEP